MMMMMKTKAKLPPPMSGWQEMTGMGWADIDMKVSVLMLRMMVNLIVVNAFHTQTSVFTTITCLRIQSWYTSQKLARTLQ